MNGWIMFTIKDLECESIGGMNLNRIDERNGTLALELWLIKSTEVRDMEQKRSKLEGYLTEIIHKQAQK